MNRSILGRILPVALLVAIAFALPACNREDEPGEEMRWTADITSADSLVRSVNTGDSVVYGWNRLVGVTEIDGEEVDVEMLGNVAYEAGSGPFFGFITLTFADGDTLALRMDGEATAATDTSSAEFTADLVILGGTGRYLNSDGQGSWSGSRQDAIGSPVRIDVELKIGRGSV